MKRHLLLISLAAAAACEGASAPDLAIGPAEGATSLEFNTPSLTSTIPAVHRIEQASSGEGQILGWCDQPAGVALLSAPGTGNLNHAGQFVLEQTSCVNLATGAITDGQGILMTANGDEIHLEYDGRVVPGVVPQTLELFYVVTGGTGRFGRAEGELSALVVYTSATTWVSTGDGWLRYTASDRSMK